jgi:broad specificity phosphatase PhoE
MKFNLYLIRHGRSVRNEDRDAAGQTSKTPLSEDGEKQAKLVGNYLSKLASEGSLRFDHIWSSSDLRAWKTAKIALGDRAPIHTTSDLRERDSGDWSEKKISDVITDEVKLQRGYLGNYFKIPGGESNNMVERRVVNWFEETFLFNEKFAKHASVFKDDIIIFSHGMAIRMFLHNIMGIDQNFLWKIDIDNTSITKLSFSRVGWKLNYLNDTSHLK